MRQPAPREMIAVNGIAQRDNPACCTMSAAAVHRITAPARAHWPSSGPALAQMGSAAGRRRAVATAGDEHAVGIWDRRPARSRGGRRERARAPTTGSRLVKTPQIGARRFAGLKQAYQRPLAFVVGG